MTFLATRLRLASHQASCLDEPHMQGQKRTTKIHSKRLITEYLYRDSKKTKILRILVKF
jgi:hypothetical protein